MKKFTLFFAFLFIIGLANAQVGIGTSTPASNLQIVGEPTNVLTPDGITIPTITANQLVTKTNNAAYGVPQTGTIVYVNAARTAAVPPASAGTLNVAAIGSYYWDGTEWQRVTPSAGNDFWATTGNTGTNPATNFIGTTDAQDVVVKTNNAERVRVLANGRVGINTNNPIHRLSVNGDAKISNNLLTVNQIELGTFDTGDRNVFLDFHSSGLPGTVDFDARIIRDPGVNGDFNIANRGAGRLILGTNTAQRLLIDAAGTINMGDAFDPVKYGQVQIARPANQPDTAHHLSFVRASNRVAGIGFMDNSNTFYITNDGDNTPTTGIFLAPDGDVGIGTTTPGGNLEIADLNTTTNSTMVRLRTQNNRTFNILAPDPTDINSPFIFQTGNSIQFQADSDEGLTILPSAEVSIPTQVLGGGTYGDVKSSMLKTDHNGWIMLNGRNKSTLTATQRTRFEFLLGATTTNLPNTQGSGQNSATYLANIDGNQNTVGSIGGNDDNLWSVSDLPNHTHSGSTSSNGNHNHVLSGSASSTTAAGGHAHAIARSGFSNQDLNQAGQTLSNQSSFGSAVAYRLARVAGVPNLGTTSTDGSHSHGINLGAITVSDAPDHNHTFTTNNGNGLGGAVVNTAPRTLDVNHFIYLGL